MSAAMMSPRELAEHLDVPESTVYSWRTRGGGPPGMRVGRHVRYRRCDVEAWLDRQLRAEQNAPGAA